MSPLRAVVFDCDGVLVDSEPHSIAAWLNVLGGRGHCAVRSDVEACTGLGYGPTYAHLAATDPNITLPAAADLWPELLEALAASFDAGLDPFADAADAVAALSAAGVPIGVASSSPRERLDLTLSRSGLIGHFAATAAGDEVQRGKPAPDVYLLAALPGSVWPLRTPGLVPSRRMPLVCRWWGWCAILPRRHVCLRPAPAPSMCWIRALCSVC